MWGGRRSHGGSRGGGELAAFASRLLCFVLFLGVVAAQRPKASSAWKTLSGNAPAIVAKGGFSGVFPDSSLTAYSFATIASAPDTTMWCDVQLTQDGVGICLRDINLQNCTNINQIYPERKKNYLVNGVPTTGWFSVDFNITALQYVSLTQAIWSRTDKFDASNFAITAVTDLKYQIKPTSLWLNFQNDIFYRQHGLNMRSYVLSITKRIVVNYISSPDLSFLGSIAKRVSPKTKLVFCFLDKTKEEPSTNQTYGLLLKNLTLIKTFASGILVPKTYIWPVTPDNYLQPYTSIVTDAHKAGLEIYAADFANDNILSYNYSYDPLAEYLSYVHNGGFCVDGVLSDYPITPSEAIGCFINLNRSTNSHGKPLIISHNGASGDYPDCTDLAYKKAVDDGADVIDCSIQVTQDGVVICMSSINLMDDTNVIRSPFSSPSVFPDIQSTPGIFTFNLTWDEIKKNLKPQISDPESKYYIQRNPRYQNAGNFLKLSDFLAFAKDKDLSGVLINIQHAAFMAEHLGFDAVNTVITALKDAGYNNQTLLEVMIQSPDSSVLAKFKQQTKYKLVYMITEDVSSADGSLLTDVKKFADAVAVTKESIYPLSEHFIMSQTNLVSRLHSAGLSVYVYWLRNEFVSQPWDFFNDATVEINTYVQGALVDGIITEFPLTARRYKRNSCMNLGNNMPAYMDPVQVGALAQLIVAPVQPPALAPMPVLNTTDVMEPPLPPVTPMTPSSGQNASGPGPRTQRSDGSRIGASIVCLLVMFCVSLLT